MFSLFQLALLAAAAKSMLMYDWDETLVAAIPLVPDLQLVVAVAFAVLVLLILKVCKRSKHITHKPKGSGGFCCKRKAQSARTEVEYEGTSRVDEDEMEEATEVASHVVHGHNIDIDADTQSSTDAYVIIPRTIVISCRQTQIDILKAVVWTLALVPIMCVISFKDKSGYTAVAVISVFASQIVTVPLWYVAELSARSMLNRLCENIESGSDSKNRMAFEAAVKLSTRTTVMFSISTIVVVVFFSVIEGFMVFEGTLDVYHTMVSFVAFFGWLLIGKMDSDMCKELESLYKASCKSIDNLPRGVCPAPEIMLVSGTLARLEEYRVMDRFLSVRNV